MILRARLLLLASTLPFVAGCGVYLHDAGLQTSTSELKTSYETLQAPAMMAELKAGEAQFASDEDRTAVEYGVAARNAALLGFIRSPSQGPRAGMAEFISQTRNELSAIYGSTTLTDADLGKLFRAPDIAADASRRRAAVAARVEHSTRGFVEARDAARRRAQQGAENPDSVPEDRRPTDCARVPPPPVGPGPTVVVEIRYLLHQNNCTALRDAELLAASLGIDALRPSAIGVSQPPSPLDDPCSPALSRPAPVGEFGRLRAELEESSRSRRCAEAQTQRLSVAIREIEEKARPGTSVAELNGAIAEVQRLLREVQPRAQLLGLEQLSTFIEGLLAVELTEGAESTTPSPTTVRGAAALQALRAIAQAHDAFADLPRIERTNALLLGAARIRHDIRMAQLDIAQERVQTQILEAQIAALVAKASNYARIQYLINDTRLREAADFTDARRNPALRGAAGEALAAYVGAWNQGEIPFRVLQLKAIQARRSTSIERATLTEADYRTSLKPVFDQLAAYGAGGVRPETIAELLGQLGVAGAILGR